MFWFLNKWFADKPVDLEGLCEREVTKAIETTIETVDPRLRLVSDCKNKLRAAVVDALLHARDLIHDIPGPLDINRRAFASDPEVHSLFGSVQQLQQVFSHSEDVRRFCKTSRESHQSHCFALLLMAMQEKQKPGFALKGDAVHADVLQNVIYFTDHQLVKVGANEAQVKRELRHRAFEQMLLQVKRKVADHQSQTNELRREQSGLKRQLRTLTGENPALVQQLAEVERELAKLSARLFHLDDYLELVVEVLTNPSEHCGLEHRDIRMSRSGVRLEQDASDGHLVRLADIRVGSAQQAGVIVRFPLEELAESSISPQFGSLYGA